jgi:hypothetical protein
MHRARLSMSPTRALRGLVDDVLPAGVVWDVEVAPVGAAAHPFLSGDRDAGDEVLQARFVEEVGRADRAVVADVVERGPDLV